MLVRTWNLFHGNTSPPRRRAFLQEMVELVSRDGPDLVCLQEVPAWALPRLAGWSGMTALGAVAARPRLRSAGLGRLVTDLHHGLLRSAVTGQANAILLAPRYAVRHEEAVAISRAGEGERRVCQLVRVDGVGTVANFHVTGGEHADEQLLRVVELVRDVEQPVILCGDANLRPGEPGRAYDALCALGFSTPVSGIDQILVRGLPVHVAATWPPERRRLQGRLLSDHAPVELRVG